MTDDDGDDALRLINEAFAAAIVQSRDERRPRIEDVVRVLDQSFARLTQEGEVEIVPDMTGPVTWSWVDRTLAREGFEKVFLVTGSAMPGTEGHPLLTVRQCIAPHFDAHLSLSTLVFGPDDGTIAHSCGLLTLNHAAAFQGVRESITAGAHGGAVGALEELHERNREFNESGATEAALGRPTKEELN